ncbi:MAG TPA: hypothetical protein VGX21_22990 [Methylomirabilota bacterium]|nr:hypothetical protein [Methylomirabilota bacterium]
MWHNDRALDEFEQLFERDVADGLPAIPPTRERVDRLLAGAPGRAAHELVGLIPPNYGRATVEKIAINAAMAGCRPEYLPVVLAAVEAVTDPAFNLHGVVTTTHYAAPLILVNGPIRHAIGLNSGAGVFGPGFRANATIGRALRLCLVNLGGARPGGIAMSTFGHPGRYTYCIAEAEEESPWPPFHVERGFGAEESTVTAFACEAPHGISDHASRTARDLAASLGWTMGGLWNDKHWPLYSETMLVVGPEHAATFGAHGWSKADLRRFLFEAIRRPYRECLPDDRGGESSILRYRPDPPGPDTLVPKFPSPDEIFVVVAGGRAGRFSCALPGWLATRNGSRLVTRAIRTA